MGFLKKALKVVAPVAGGIVGGPVGAFIGDQAAGGHYTDKLTNKVGSMMNNLSGSTDMLRQEMANNIQLWNMQNQYNTPSAQVARMAAAGINVNPMTYAVGNGNMTTTATNISAPSVGASGINPIASLMGVISGLKDLKMAGVNADYTDAQTSHVYNQINNENKVVRQQVKSIKEQMKKSQAERGQILMNNMKNSQEINRLIKENALLDQDLFIANQEREARRANAYDESTLFARGMRHLGRVKDAISPFVNSAVNYSNGHRKR